MQKNTRTPIRFTVTAAMIAAIYAVLTLCISPLAYGPIQFRFSEIMIMLAATTPAAIPGLTIGCALANLGSPYGLLDIFCGSGATLLAALFAYLVRRVRWKEIPLLSPLGAVVFNALIVGLVIKITSDTPVLYIAAAAEVGLGELAVCYAAGIPFWLLLKKSGVLGKL